MNLQDTLGATAMRDDDNVRFLAHADLVPDGVDAFLFLVGVEGQVVESTVGESVAVIWR